jgi:short-subunit dehydrogenase
MSTEKVWFVTGASQGLGLSLVKKLLKSGYRVAATSRNAQSLKDATGMIESRQFLPIGVDLNNLDSIKEAIQQTVATFGRIDVAVNNAGYGMIGTIEEIGEHEVKNIFNINVLATMFITKNILPIMRMQQSGFIINIGSVAGFVGAPGWSVYSATKAAIAAFSEVLAQDVKEFGIKVTVVEPSGFRTGFLSKNSLALSAGSLPGYQAVKDTQTRYLAASGREPGDPDRAAETLIELSENQQPPLHLYLGQDAYNRASKKMAAMITELEEWKATTISADFQK